MFSNRNGNEQFLEQLKIAREARALEQKRTDSAIRIQAYVRGFLARRLYTRLVLEEYDDVFSKIAEINFNLIAVVEIYGVIKKLLTIFKLQRDRDRFEKLCRYVVNSLRSESTSISFIGVFLKKDYSLEWIAQVRLIMNKCMEYLGTLNPRLPDDARFMLVLFHTMISFTSVSTWVVLRTNSDLDCLRQGMEQFCNNTMSHLLKLQLFPQLRDLMYKKLLRSPESKSTIGSILYAVTTLSVRALYYAKYTDHMLGTFIAFMFCVPTYIFHVHHAATDCWKIFHREKILHRIMDFMKRKVEIKIENFSFEGNYLISFMANFVQLGHIFIQTLSKEDLTMEFMDIIMDLLKRSQTSILKQQSNHSYWHLILGWCRRHTHDIELHEFMPNIKYQLSLLWSYKYISLLFLEPLESSLLVNESETPEPPKSALRKVMDYLTHKPVEVRKETYQIAAASHMFYTMTLTFSQLRLDILTGLCYQSSMLNQLWKFFQRHYSGMKMFFRLLVYMEDSASVYALVPNDNYMLILFNECMTHFVTILDDVEMYEERTAFFIQDFLQLGSFLNMFVYKGIYNDVFRQEENDWTILFNSSHTLLTVLYMRDCRRSYAPKNHWLIKEIKVSSFIHDLEKNKVKSVFLKDKLPHAVPCKDRVHLFRKIISAEKMQFAHTERNCIECITNGVRVIRIRREQIVEDAFCNLQGWNNTSIKKVFRVKFINEQGLEEAGIDQAGVFREFIEEFMKRIFDPGLNLFKRTSDDHLYPSPESNMQENHLQLIEFAGKMLAKAIYEGMIVDVRLASFFLSQVLGQTQSTLYSYIDDLPSLDPDLYRSLMQIKHYTGDTGDMELTFSTTEEVFGSIVEHDLVPNGKSIPVTNSNKIIYIHMMAHFRMYTQIKSQIMSFSRGFYSVFSKEHLKMFSTPEFQLLISGKDEPINIAELRQYTQYYGGFHDNHKVIIWLWEVLQQDFTEEERALFLKFVTSSSKAPLLGFSYLHPPMSIRCVEVSEDEDTGDSIGSVIRGFFTIRRRGPEFRLPSASTCFNLLKLPNYSRKSILREKLRYAITSNTGFELS